MVYQWELDIIRNWDVNTIRNRIWIAEACGQSVPGCVSVEAMRTELIRRGEEPKGYHDS